MTIGKTLTELRRRAGLTQRAAAIELMVSPVHLCNCEKSRSVPSWELLAAMRELYGVDPYVYAWCQYGNTGKLPPAVRKAAKALRDAWRIELESKGCRP